MMHDFFFKKNILLCKIFFNGDGGEGISDEMMMIVHEIVVER
jgi:hypothetical protein